MERQALARMLRRHSTAGSTAGEAMQMILEKYPKLKEIEGENVPLKTPA